MLLNKGSKTPRHKHTPTQHHTQDARNTEKHPFDHQTTTRFQGPPHSHQHNTAHVRRSHHHRQHGSRRTFGERTRWYLKAKAGPGPVQISGAMGPPAWSPKASTAPNQAHSATFSARASWIRAERVPLRSTPGDPLRVLPLFLLAR